MTSNTFNSRFFTALLLLGVLACGSRWAVANEPCIPVAGNEYEKIFCDLKRKGKGSTLPSLREFRNNPPLTQAFLLKKPAERAGIHVRIPERNNEETLRRQEELLAALEASAEMAIPVIVDKSTPTTPPQPQPVAIPVTRPAAKPPAKPKTTAQAAAPVAPVATAPAPLCVLQEKTLSCDGVRYTLAGNKTNQQLDPSMLTEHNRLGMPVYSGDPADALAEQQYVQEAYRHYLEGMLRIGLGASTMSYTKFANLYDYITEQRLDFVGRFETMYHFLKEDKLAIGVSTQLVIADGFDATACRQLDRLVACDYQKTNYLFIRQP